MSRSARDPGFPEETSRRLALFGRLDRYVLRTFLGALVVSAIVVVGLYLVVDLASNLDDYLDPPEGITGSEQLALVARYYAIEALFLLFQVAPFITLSGGMYTVHKLHKNRELIAAMGLGWSVRRVQLPVFLAALTLAIGMVAGREFAMGEYGFLRGRLLHLIEEGGTEVSFEKLRFKDATGELIELAQYLPGPDPSGDGASFVGLDAVRNRDGRFFHYVIERGVHVGPPGAGGFWDLEGGSLEAVEEGGKNLISIDSLDGELDFTPDDIWSAFKGRNDAMDLSYAEAQSLARRDPDNVQYATLLNYLISFPLANIVLLLCGLPLMMQFERGRAGRGLVTGFLLCIFYFAADFFSLNLGMQGHLSPLLAAFLPPLFFGSLGIVLFASARS